MVVKKNRGWIALDIDGTITDQLHSVPPQVIHALKNLFQQGWELVFLTGRTFSFGHSVLKSLDFPYHLAVQNGADILEMPEQRLFNRCYLKESILAALETAYIDQREDFLVYAGYEKGDFCYYRPHRFSPQLLLYLERLQTLSPEPWQAMDSFHFASDTSFPLIKCLGTKGQMLKIHEILRTIPSIQVTMIRDPMAHELYLNLITDDQATRGHALERLLKHRKKEGPLIAAGDDFNDLSMLRLADTRIVMETAPQEVLEEADLVAPSASKGGIVEALNKAVKLWD